MADREKMAYTAGLFDGEGSVSIRKRRPGLTPRTVAPVFCLLVRLSNTDQAMTDFLLATHGGRVQPCKAQNERWLAQWQWQLDSRRGANFLLTIRPWLITKAADADLAIAFQAEVDSHRRGTPLTAAELQRREAFRDELMGRRHSPGRGGRRAA
jgi:hypothetical protein